MKKLFLFILSAFCSLQAISENVHVVEPLALGNFALPYSQQPGPLFGFGQNVIDPHDLQGIFYASAFIGPDNSFTEFIPYLLYGITHNASIFVALPFDRAREGRMTPSLKFADLMVQVEYAFYNKSSLYSVDQMTVIGAISMPSGSIRGSLPNSTGSVSFFIGATQSHTTIDWYMFLTQGVLLTTKRNNRKSGNQYLYQGGIGRNFGNPRGWIFTPMVEIFGTYLQHNKECCQRDPNTGGNVVFIGPSVWLSSERFYLQLGLGIPLSQNFFGDQNKTTVAPTAEIGWTFA
jgi:hypothetical protein